MSIDEWFRKNMENKRLITVNYVFGWLSCLLGLFLNWLSGYSEAPWNLFISSLSLIIIVLFSISLRYRIRFHLIKR